MLFLEKPDRNGPLEKPRHICKDNITIDTNEIEERMWIYLVQDRNKWRAIINTMNTMI